MPYIVSIYIKPVLISDSKISQQQIKTCWKVVEENRHRFGMKINFINKLISSSLITSEMINDKGLYGLVSGVITTAILQPFENIKMALMLPPRNLELKYNFVKNMGLATSYIYRNDGYKGFYKGLIAAINKAGFGCYIYFACLRYLENPNQSLFMDFLHSSFARIISAILTNPLSIIETRFELADFHQYTSVHGAIRDIYQKEGIGGFFSGALASCLKEGIFAGLYYMIYEEMKEHGYNRFGSGIASGMLATSITHPFEIIRARLQTIGLTQQHSINQHLIYKQLKNLLNSGQWLKGLTPRLFKKPLANTLTFFFFQLIEDHKKAQKTQ